MEFLDGARQQIEAGDRGGARRALCRILNADPTNVAAWTLLATVVDDADKQADCYRRILALDPGNREAERSLRQLTRERPVRESPETPSSSQAAVPLRCPQCGGTMEARFVGDLRDKRAVCPYCGAQVDLPDTYRRVTHEREYEENACGARIIERTESQTRSDRLEGDPRSVPQAIRESLDELARQVEEHDGEMIVTRENRLKDGTPRRVVLTSEKLHELSDEELFEWLKERGIDLGAPEGLLPGEQIGIRRAIRRTDSWDGVPSLRDVVRGWMDRGVKRSLEPQEPLSVDDIIDLAGGPLAPEERRPCPQCGAVIPRDAARCEWCGTRLSGDEERKD